jgi:hypothetical protein
MFGRHVDLFSSAPQGPVLEESETELDLPLLGADLLRRIRRAACIRSSLCDSTASTSLG